MRGAERLSCSFSDDRAEPDCGASRFLIWAGAREVKAGCLSPRPAPAQATGDPVQDLRSATCIATIEPATAFATRTQIEYHRRGFDQIRRPVILGDGANGIWILRDPTHAVGG